MDLESGGAKEDAPGAKPSRANKLHALPMVFQDALQYHLATISDRAHPLFHKHDTEERSERMPYSLWQSPPQSGGTYMSLVATRLQAHGLPYM
jgi:hypothetical protein